MEDRRFEELSEEAAVALSDQALSEAFPGLAVTIEQIAAPESESDPESWDAQGAQAWTTWTTWVTWVTWVTWATR